MQLYKKLLPNRVTNKPVAFTFGTFDGVHRGHQFLLRYLIQEAKRKQLIPAILTFSNHPAEILSPKHMPMQLTTADEKRQILLKLGFEIIIEVPFTKEFAALSADEFIDNLLAMLPIALWIVGEDVTFGRNRQGNKELLITRASQYGFEVEVVEKFSFEGQVVSSSLIRSLLKNGDIELASHLLGRT